MRGNSLVVVMSALLLSGTACKGDKGSEGGGEGGGDCGGPLEVVADGKPFEVKKALAVTQPKHKVTLVYGFNYPDATCESALKGSFQHPEGGMGIRVSDSSTDAVGIGAHTQIGGEVDVTVVKKGEKAGDQVEVCVKKVTFQPTVGPYKQKDVTMSGKLSAEYCGEMKQ